MLDYKELDFHSLRHTHASNLLAAGVDPTYVQARLDHKNIENTLQIYSHVKKKMKDKNINILNSL